MPSLGLHMSASVPAGSGPVAPGWPSQASPGITADSAVSSFSCTGRIGPSVNHTDMLIKKIFRIYIHDQLQQMYTQTFVLSQT